MKQNTKRKQQQKEAAHGPSRGQSINSLIPYCVQLELEMFIIFGAAYEIMSAGAENWPEQDAVTVRSVPEPSKEKKKWRRRVVDMQIQQSVQIDMQTQKKRVLWDKQKHMWEMKIMCVLRTHHPLSHQQTFLESENIHTQRILQLPGGKMQVASVVEIGVGIEQMAEPTWTTKVQERSYW